VPLSTFEHSSNQQTSTSLIRRVRSRDDGAWVQLVSVYGPTVYGWCRVRGLSEHDAGDLVQTVFLSVSSAIQKFRREQEGDTFRGWLRTITRNCIADHFRANGETPEARGGTTGYIRLQEHAGAGVSDLELSSDSDVVPNELAALCRRVLDLLRPEFESQVWESFERTVIHGDRVADVAADLGIAISSVYKSKTRVLNKLRQAMADE
jgi:RNA polymerase sigma-70 factor, ECF subfamily